ncbi:DNA repair protein RecO [Aurantibacillus circumpalustris]|uniref:DNA repair protein RecO n=1 Tax=Aurantibacillus circumpalustris TaxID=3036359 RepID=UPI00295AD48A|nr:DNA repair protein RecO [Aurantibacillus circumpalustris]
MRVSDQAIVLQAIKHGDKKFILKLYTRGHGMITVSTHVSNGVKSKIKPASVLPLSLMDVELIVKENKEIHQLTEASCYYVSSQISNSIAKLSIAQFLNEILIKTLKEQSANTHVYEFIETCLKFLNDTDNCINLHLYFLSEFTRYLGFEPQNNFTSNTPYFDCREGRFSSVGLTMPLGLNKEDSLLFSEFLKINSLKSGITNVQRQTLLEILLAYYKLHVPGFNEVKSLEVLREVVSG